MQVNFKTFESALLTVNFSTSVEFRLRLLTLSAWELVTQILLDRIILNFLIKVIYDLD